MKYCQWIRKSCAVGVCFASKHNQSPITATAGMQCVFLLTSNHALGHTVYVILTSEPIIDHIAWNQPIMQHMIKAIHKTKGFVVARDTTDLPSPANKSGAVYPCMYVYICCRLG